MQASELRSEVEKHVKDLVLSSAHRMRECCDKASHTLQMSSPRLLALNPPLGLVVVCHNHQLPVENVGSLPNS